ILLQFGRESRHRLYFDPPSGANAVESCPTRRRAPVAASFRRFRCRGTVFPSKRVRMVSEGRELARGNGGTVTCGRFSQFTLVIARGQVVTRAAPRQSRSNDFMVNVHLSSVEQRPEACRVVCQISGVLFIKTRT